MKELIIIVVATLFSVASMAQNVGVGTDSPVPSAKLEVRSTDKGFLPPRMTAAQRDSIVGPVAGLMLYCTNCGSNGEIQFYNGNSWRNMVGAAAALPPVGQRFLGGILAYALQSGDPGYDPATPHGIIMASDDQSTGIAWYNGTFVQTNASGTDIGTGNQNTNTIITVQGAGSYAAKLCADLVLDGYSDWYLPSLEEFRKVLMVPAVNLVNGAEYWTSSEITPIGMNDAWSVHTIIGDLMQLPKSEICRVRAIRSF
jgi:hypothetical protein